jgi:hypothetical protein
MTKDQKIIRAKAGCSSRPVALAIEQPAWGQARASNELLKRGISISPFGVRSVFPKEW